MEKKSVKHEIWHPSGYSVSEHRAVQLLGAYAEGVSDRAPTPEEVKIALDWIIYRASAYTDNGFIPDDHSGRVAAFVDGRQSVAQQIVKLMKLKIEIGVKNE